MNQVRSEILRWIKRLLFVLLIGGGFWLFYQEEYQEDGLQGIWGEFQSDIQEIREHPAVQHTVDYLHFQFHRLHSFINEEFFDTENPSPIEKPDLHQPEEQIFSINNIEINDDKAIVTDQLGEPARSTVNEYGTEWLTYHEEYHHFLMIAFDHNDQVIGLYTNQNLLTSTENITFESNKKEVRNTLGEPLDSIRKGLVKYQFNEEEEHDTFLIDNNYVTVFYDAHQDHVIAAIQIISKGLEDQKSGYYAEPSQELKEGFEYQLYDLTNAARVKFDLPVLSWHEKSRKTGREHSTDMAENNYFGHTNLNGESPFDRLAEDNIDFTMAGENLAAGQPSSIFAHQGLMNSEGHRKNILKKDFRQMSVGVSFQEDGHPLYTETFLTK